MKKLLWIIKSILYIITSSILLFRILSVNALAVENYQYLPDSSLISNNLNCNGNNYIGLPIGTVYNNTSNPKISYIPNTHSNATYINCINQWVRVRNSNEQFNFKSNKEYKMTLYIGSKLIYNPLNSVTVFGWNQNDGTGNISTSNVSYKKIEPRTGISGILSEYRYEILISTGNNVLLNDPINITMEFNNQSVYQAGMSHIMYRTYTIEEIVTQNNKELIGAVNKVEDSIKNQTDLIKDTDSSQAINSAGGFFEGFTTDTYGLTSVITAPLVMINNLVSSNCVAIPLELIGYDFSLPCIDSLIPSAFSPLLTIYRVATDAIIGYWVMVNILALVKGFKDPEKDNIEVLEL